MASEADNIRVAVRIRPLVPSEQDRGCQEAVERVRDAPQVIVNRTDTFTFNYVFDAEDSQEHIYNAAVPELLGKLMDGFNATILAYGQTGSGKTHTMGTACDGQLTSESGLIPRVMCDIFERLQTLSNQYEYCVKCSFVELYQEQLYDLLSDQPREQAVVDIRENRNGIVLVGLTELNVASAQETADCLVRGSAGRAVGATAMNELSSRSHAIFTISLQLTKKDETCNVTTSKFHLVDLAGSERSKKTQATGDRFKEGVKINQGLLALGNVISALGSGQGAGFVRYRDSKLTRLLQDSLGGNSVTLMIACVSPADYNVAETLSTLRYADRARKIKNKPIVNQDPLVTEVNNLKSIIQKLRLDLLAAGGGASIQVTDSTTDHWINSDAYQLLQAKYQNIQQQFQATLHDLAEAELRAHLAEELNEKFKLKTEEMKCIIEEVAQNLQEVSSDDRNNTCVQRLKSLSDELKFEPESTKTELKKLKLYEESKKCESDEGEFMSASTKNVEIDAGTKDNKIELMEVQSILQEQAESFTNTQMNYKEQLCRVNRELNLKQELQQRVNGNFMQFCNLHNDTEKYKECEQKIKELEAEKSDLLDKLKHVKDNASAKLAEERRKRLRTLELELNEMKRQILQQAKLLRVKEKEAQKLQNLQKEIQAMKESKVKLIRAMRQESENFRQSKLLRERELIQLRNKDRKLQNEMARKDALHTKQRNVLKRKCEEALAINKRLKDALDGQKIAQAQRQKQQMAKDAATPKTKAGQLISWVERELEVIVSQIDAEHSLEQLMEDRVVIKNRIAELQCPESPADGSAQILELKTLQEEFEMRNAQITDLQQKVCSVSLETRMRTLYESVQNISEARSILKQLLKSILDMRREHSNRLHEQKDALTEQYSKRQAAEQSCAAMTKRLRFMELEHEQAIAERQNEYEEKITILLKELHNASQESDGTQLTSEQEECRKIVQEHLLKIDTMQEELEYYKNQVADLRQAGDRKRQQQTGDHKKKSRTDDDSEQPNEIGLEKMDWDKTASDIESEENSSKQ